MSAIVRLNPVLNLTPEELESFCRRYRIRKLSLFGSALRGELRPDSDIDILVEFEPEQEPTLIALSRMELELSDCIGRKADLRTPEDLSRYFRDEVMAAAEILYEQR